MDAPCAISTRTKKARVKQHPSLPSLSTTTCPDSSTLPPPPPPLPRPHLISLPALVHDAISSFLARNDGLRVMEVSQWASNTYGACVKLLVFHHVRRYDHFPIQRILKRRPALVELTITDCCNNNIIKELVEAMAEGSCNKLQRLELGELSPQSRGVSACLSPLYDVLGHGACPNMIHLSLSFDDSGNQTDRDNTMKDLGGVLRSRVDKGCQGLKVLQFQGLPPYRLFTISLLSPLLSSGACDKLEELRLESCDLKDPASDALKEWLLRTKASRLHTFLGYETRADVIEALSSPGVARRLHVLELVGASPETVMQLSVPLEHGAWWELKELSIGLDGGVSNNLAPRLMESICVGAPELRSLYLFNLRMGTEGARILAQGLRDGACPRLEELSFWYGSIGDVGVRELVKAMMEGTPCNMTLQRLHFGWCDIGDRGMEELARAVTQGGALPNLEDLQLGGNSFGDEGVVYLAEAMKDGGLPQLKELGLTSVRIGTPGMSALSQALVDHHACPRLGRLDIWDAYPVSDEVKRALINGLDASRGQGKVKVQL